MGFITVQNDFLHTTVRIGYTGGLGAKPPAKILCFSRCNIEFYTAYIMQFYTRLWEYETLGVWGRSPQRKLRSCVEVSIRNVVEERGKAGVWGRQPPGKIYDL